MIECCVESIEHIIDFLEPIIDLITLLIITLLNKNESNSDLTDYDNDDVPSPGGDDSEPDDNDDKNKKLDKGKGKAKAITPELIPEEIQEPDEDEKQTETDLEKAKFYSLREHKHGESSKEGATLQERELAFTQEEINTGLSDDDYRKANGIRRDMIRDFNDIIIRLTDDGNLSEAEREYLVDKSIKLRNEVTNYDNYLQYLKDVLNIQSSQEECSSKDDSSEDFTSESSSEEESRPTKRPRN